MRLLGSGINLTVSIEGKTEFVVAYRAATDGLFEDLNHAHRTVGRSLKASALKHLEASIIHKEVSDTASGKVYRPRSRMTTRFGGETWKTRVLEKGPNKDIQGFGFPDVVWADKRTDGAWRALEFGSGPRSEVGVPHIRPRFFVGLPVAQIGLKGRAAGRFGMRGGSGNPDRDRRRTGGRTRGASERQYRSWPRSGPIFQPTTRETVRGGGSAPKHFLRDAFLEVTAKLPREYKRMMNERFSALRGLPN